MGHYSDYYGLEERRWRKEREEQRRKDYVLAEELIIDALTTFPKIIKMDSGDGRLKSIHQPEKGYEDLAEAKNLLEAALVALHRSEVIKYAKERCRAKQEHKE